MSNYRETLDQYNVLKEELAKFSEELSQRKFAIALTKIDAINPEELNEKVDAFIKGIGLENANENSFAFEKEKNYYVQDLTFNKYDSSLPYFILPISSVTNQNIKSIKYALYDLVRMEK